MDFPCGLVIFATMVYNGLGANHHQIKLNDGMEYCNMEKFNVSCAADEVLLIERAQYGRMRLGRCVQDDLGSFVGCRGDALPYMDDRCSGKQGCVFDIPNPELARYTQCPKELVHYLQVLHHCVKVVEKKNMVCHSAHRLSSSSGYLSSSIAANQGLGTARCPWVVNVPSGQVVELHLMHFAPLDAFEILDGGCLSYGHIRDISDNNNHDDHHRSEAITACRNDGRQKRVYTSSGSQVEISFASSQSLQGLAPILLKYEAVGCPDLPPQPGRTVIKKENKVIEIRCNNSNDVWFMNCEGSEWKGILGNCTSGSGLGNPEATNGPDDSNYPFPYKLALVVAAGVALGVFLGGTLLLCANVYLKRKQVKRQKDLYGCDLEYKFNNRDHPMDSHTLQRHSYQRVDTAHHLDDHVSKATIPRSRHNSEDLLSPIDPTEQQRKSSVSYLKEYSTYPPPPYDTNRSGVIQLNCKSTTVPGGGAMVGVRKAGHLYEHPMTCSNK